MHSIYPHTPPELIGRKIYNPALLMVGRWLMGYRYWSEEVLRLLRRNEVFGWFEGFEGL